MAIGFVQVWARFHVQDNTVAILHAALGLKVRHGFSFWDSAIIAAAAALGCRELFTEDMNHGQVVDGVTIVNPFL
jgi:predicted nucleic acid-binding protein